MNILEYRDEFRDDCLDVLKSNVGKFIAAWEVDEYEKYLKTQAHQESYFVVLDGKEVVACGGYGIVNGTAFLSWGLVRRNRHGEGIGTLLLSYRLNRISTDYSGLPLKIDTSQNTQGFYQKFGFYPTKVVNDGYDKGLDKVYMEYREN